MKPLPCTPENLTRAAQVLREGGLLVVPTETVYGLAADALNSKAVRRIFEAKGRPSDNPLICHVAELGQAKILTGTWPASAQMLAERFWPGPLTLVLPKNPQVPRETTAGLDTVAVRLPGHEAFRRIIATARTPVAAPSANLFMGVSPTSVEQLDPALVNKVDLVLDGGPCAIGIESSVVDLSGANPAVLRPGMISTADIEAVLKQPVGPYEGSERRSPGMHRRHYSPKARLLIVESAGTLPGLVFGPVANDTQITMPSNPADYAARLYEVIHQMDKVGYEEIFVEAPPDSPEWQAIWDRLKRAASEK